jgi:hypothetical protein
MRRPSNLDPEAVVTAIEPEVYGFTAISNRVL